MTNEIPQWRMCFQIIYSSDAKAHFCIWNGLSGVRVCVCVVLWFIGMVCTLKIYNYLFISYAVSSFSFCLSQNFPFVLTFWNDASTSYRGLMMFFFNMSIRFDCFAVTFYFDFFYWLMTSSTEDVDGVSKFQSFVTVASKTVIVGSGERSQLQSKLSASGAASTYEITPHVDVIADVSQH